MRKFLKEIWPYVLGFGLALSMLITGKSQGYEKGYQDGFDNGLDTAGVELDNLLDSAKAILIDLQEMQTESFPNHSEIKP